MPVPSENVVFKDIQEFSIKTNLSGDEELQISDIEKIKIQQILDVSKIINLEYDTTITKTRLNVGLEKRKYNITLIYVLPDNTLRLETYISKIFTDSYWLDNNNWKQPLSYDKEFINVNLDTNNNYVIDYKKDNNYLIDLHSNVPGVTYLSITNLPINQGGQILIKQSGNKILIPDSNMIQELELPIQINKVSLIYFINIGDIIYLYQNKIVSDVNYNGPLAIDTLLLGEFDGLNLSLKWLEPDSNSPNNESIDGYDIRISNSPITDTAGWLNASKITPLPPVVGRGVENSISYKLKPGRSYYIYIKTYKYYRGSYYLSPISNEVHVVTKSYMDVVIGEPKMMPLDIETCYSKLNKYEMVNGVMQDMSFLFDKEYTAISSSDERPDTSVKILGATSWTPQKYWEDSLPYSAIFDLQELITVDSIYLFTRERCSFEVYGSVSDMTNWEHLGAINIGYNDWGFVSLREALIKDYQYIKISIEEHYYAVNNTEAEGTPCWSTSKEVDDVKSYTFFGVFGYPKSTKPLTIKRPIRDYSTKYTIGDVINVNGHFYQDGRIHSMVGGKYPRLFGHFGHFDAKISYNTERYSSIEEFKFKTEEIGWVSDNCSHSDWTLVDLLQNTYKPYGLLPILTASGKLDSILRKKYSLDKDGNRVYTGVQYSKYVDQNYFDKDNPPMPIKGVNGIKELLDVTMLPINYRINSKLCYVLAAKYGSTKLSEGEEALLPIETEEFTKETKVSGLNLIGGIEDGNEDNATWNGWEAYMQPQEAGAWLTALYDGNVNTLVDENGNKIKGIKGVCPNLLVLNPGLVGLDAGYFFTQDFYARQLRQDPSIPLDVYSIHSYSSEAGIIQDTNPKVDKGVPFDMQSTMQRYLTDVVRYRNTYAPTKQIWITEFGFGESGDYNTQSNYTCYSQPGYVKDGYTIPDVHRSEVKAAWTIRSIIDAIYHGANALHYYSTENEGNWFDEGAYGSGGGYEMFEWDKLTNTTPGAKVEAIKPYMVKWGRGGFASMGLFGAILANGGYPIMRGTWHLMTFRNRLKDYYFTGVRKVVDKSDLRIACFSHKEENKSAIVIYRIGNTNSCYTNVYIDVPEGTSKVELVKRYIPKLPDPRTVPYSLSFGLDKNRTGLKTSIREYDENNKVISAEFPTEEENPYFPIVGPVNSFGVSAKYPGSGDYSYINVTAEQYLNSSSVIGVDAALAYRQVDAICDYIDFHEEGIKGANGTLKEVTINQSKIKINVVTELPEIYLFTDGIFTPTYEATIEDLEAVAQSANSIKLYWNNTNPKDESYDLYMSTSPNGGYSLMTSIEAGIANEYLVSGLNPSTTYYFKLQPKFKGNSGTLSNYATMRTYDYVQTPENLTAQGKSISSILVDFNSMFETSVENNFLNYTIERKEQNGVTTLFTITDRTKTNFLDTGLQPGTSYSYKVMVITYNGNSSWTSYVSTRTYTPEEASPTVTKAETDKVVNVIRVYFDIDLDTVPSGVLGSFVVTEGGNTRVLTNALVDTSNAKLLILTYFPDSMSEFDKGLPILLSYNKSSDSSKQLKSIYGNAVDTFSGVTVKNNYGNYNNLIHSYQVNFTNNVNTNTNAGWNKILPLGYTPTSMILKDKFDYQGNLLLSILGGSKTVNGVEYYYGLHNNSATDGLYAGTDLEVPEDVYKTHGIIAYQATNNRRYYTHLRLSGLNDNNLYRVRLYSSKTISGSNVAYVSFDVNGVESGLFNYGNNNSNFVTFNGVTSINGEINVKMYNEGLVMGSDAPLNFLIIDEYEDSTQPDTTTVYIKQIFVRNKYN